MRSAALARAPSVRRACCFICLLAAAWLACSDGGNGGLGVSGSASGGLVFVREERGNADLMRARLSDRGLARITRTPDREEHWPYWSSVARRVVFQVRPYGPSLITDLRLWDPASGEETVVTRTPRRDERWPAWSPSKPELAYVFKDPRGPTGVAVCDTETWRTRVIARAGRRDPFQRPQFSPDGEWLVAERRTPTRQTRLWLIENGRSPRPLTEGTQHSDGKASFARDGSSLVFTRRDSEAGPGDLMRLDLATGEVTPIASLPGADDHSGKFSPVRDEIAFISDRDGSMDVFLVELPDGVPRNLTRTADLHEGAPHWSPDGERLVILRFLSRDADDEGNHLVRPDPKSARVAVIDRSGRLLFETPGTMADWMPAWP